MAKKLDIDWKNLLLQKGEKIGFGVAVALMALFMVFGVKGMFSGSPSANAERLNKITGDKKQLLASNKPRDMSQFQVDPSLLTTQATLDPIDPNQYAEAVAYYIPFVPEDTKRRDPKIEKPVDVVVHYVPAQVRTKAYDGKEFKQIWVLQGSDVKGNEKTNAALQKNLTAGGPGGGGMGGPMMQMMGGMKGGGGGGMMGGMMSGAGQGNNPFQQTRGQQQRQPSRTMKNFSTAMVGDGGAGRGSSDKNKERLALIKIEELSKSNAKPAARVLAVRMVLVQGAFPLRKQLEDMKSALHSPNLAEALRELRFEGVEFQRREIGPDGKPVTEEFSDADSIGLRFDEYLRTVGRLSAINVESAEEDEEMAPLIVRGLGLVYRLPVQFEGRKYPSSDIKELKETLQAIKEKGINVEVTQDPTAVSTDDLLADSGSNQQSTTTGGGVGTPKQGVGGTKPMGAVAPGADTAKEGAGVPKTGKPGLATPEGGASTAQGANWEPPEYCLFRFLDVSAEPGKTYEYRYRLKMKNPNENKDKEVAWPDLAKKKFVLSQWFELPQRVTIPADFHFYAVDMKEMPEYAKTRPISGQPLPQKGQVAFQLHRWVDLFAAPDTGRPEAVGDWAVKDRVLFWYGEFVGGPQPVELPRWNMEDDQFEITADPRDKRPKPVPVPFTESDTECPILLDSWGGTVSYRKPGEERRNAEIKDMEIPREVLLLSPEGRLFVRNSVNEAKDSEREAHFQEWKQRVEEVKQQGNVKKPEKAKDKEKGGETPFTKGGGKQ